MRSKRFSDGDLKTEKKNGEIRGIAGKLAIASLACASVSASFTCKASGIASDYLIIDAATGETEETGRYQSADAYTQGISETGISETDDMKELKSKSTLEQTTSANTQNADKSGDEADTSVLDSDERMKTFSKILEDGDLTGGAIGKNDNPGVDSGTGTGTGDVLDDGRAKGLFDEINAINEEYADTAIEDDVRVKGLFDEINAINKEYEDKAIEDVVRTTDSVSQAHNATVKTEEETASSISGGVVEREKKTYNTPRTISASSPNRTTYRAGALGKNDSDFAGTIPTSLYIENSISGTYSVGIDPSVGDTDTGSNVLNAPIEVTLAAVPLSEASKYYDFSSGYEFPTTDWRQFGTELEDLGNFTLTAYDACMICCGKTDGITSTGTKCFAGRTIAVDPNVIPYGSKVLIGNYVFVAEDCGGKIKGKHIDMYMDTHEVAKMFGKRVANVKIIR